jgi:type I restriction enzyme S subunit
MNIKQGYKQTEIGIIPEDWEVKQLKDIFKLKNGYGFSSVFFSDTGVIVITPGNFKLDGGLFFNLRNTTRYSGEYLPSMKFEKGDLLIVMTDLTPNCNLLGKPGFINTTEEIILHNQRIGKIILITNLVDRNYLYRFFLSESYAKRMKETATGSTVRHTSNASIYNTFIPIPPLKEQTAIATALSDIDALIGELDKLIAKKQGIKQATMQQLLTGKKRLAGFSGEWEVKRLGDVADIIGGGTPSTFVSNYWNGNINWFTPTEIGTEKYVFDSVRKITKDGLINCSAKILPIGTILLTTRAGIGDISILKKEACTNQGFQSFVTKDSFYNEFLYYLISTLKNVLIQNASGSTFLEISPNKIKQIQISIPTIEEQTAIATILSDMDAEISQLEGRRAKMGELKQGMMQELLTGRIRLTGGRYL